jgi:hypothetical protein
VRHSLNIIVAMLSMAAGAWQGTTAQTEQSGSPAGYEQSRKASTGATLRGCVQRGQAPGSFLLSASAHEEQTGLDPGSAAQPREHGSAASVAGLPEAPTITYELVAGGPEVDLAAFVGKHVEAQGTPERTAHGATADDSPAAAAAAADSPSGKSPAGSKRTTSQRSRVRITAIRPVSGPCE